MKVVPGSSRNRSVGWLGDSFEINVTALPAKGRTNEVVFKLLAEKLGVSTDDIQIVSGHSAQSKVIAIHGMDDEAIK
jgi:uncharacterized protein (TIGR00251 family)